MMGTRWREVLLLALVAVTVNAAVNKTHKDAAVNEIYQYEDYDTADQEEVLFNEDKPCPRDCICTVSQGYRIAKCNRLEVGTQKFGDDITDLIIENTNVPISLDDNIFRKLGLHQIATVKIVNSTIVKVGPNAFHGLQELYAVNLSNNKLNALHPETFANNKKLLLLTLANNEIKFPESGSDAYFLNASSIQELDVSYCNIKYIAPSAFKNMPGLMYLNVAGNSLSDIDPETFKKLLDLEELDLSDNNIRTLPDDLFSENTELATLHIQRNPIDTVLGLEISDLLTLNAGQTQIKFVGPSMFNGMTYIANLNLSGNGIEKIHNQAFHKLVELNYLDLSYNNLDLMSSILIKENIELDIFKISNNPKLKHLPENGFECAAEQFNIYLFDASHCGLTEINDNSLSTFTALSQINLSGNKIAQISPKVFSRSPKLVDINLSYNMLSSLDSKMFANNKELNKLHIQGNPLKVVAAETFVHTPGLTWLDMSHTELTSLWNEDKNRPATLLNNLVYLNVSHCRINIVKVTELEVSKKLSTFDVSYNPLVCNPDFENLMIWLNKQKVSPNGNTGSIANLARDGKDEETNNSWEGLTRKVCGTALPHPVDPLPPAVSDEEIWERIDEDKVGNFDLKNTLDDGKVPDDKIVDKKKTTDAGEDLDDDSDEDADDDDDEEDEDDEDDDYDEDEDDVNLNVKLLENKPKDVKVSTTTTPAPEQPAILMDIKLIEDDLYNNADKEIYMEGSEEFDHGRYDYIWPMLIALLGALLLLAVIGKIMMVVCSRKNQQIRYNSAIIAAMSQQGRTKKDCGLVYQQLSEDLKGPATPKLNRYAPLHAVTINATNTSYESSPFHNKDTVPQAV